MILYALVIRYAAPALGSGEGPAPVGIGVVLALVPAVLWLAIFYTQDAREPEPLGYVLRVVMAAAVLGGAVAVPLVRVLYGPMWISADTTTQVLGLILLVGSIQQFCNYLAIRFTVFELDEFDEVADGVTYGTAAGIGLSMVVNVLFVLGGPSIDPLPAALRLVVTTLAYATFGGVLGYFLGRAKVLGQPGQVVWGYIIATILNGGASALLQEVSQVGGAYRPWNGLIFAAALSVIVTLVLFRLVRIHQDSSAGGTGPTEEVA